jgi:hypothetical protein
MRTIKIFFTAKANKANKVFERKTLLSLSFCAFFAFVVIILLVNCTQMGFHPRNAPGLPALKLPREPVLGYYTSLPNKGISPKPDEVLGKERQKHGPHVFVSFFK